MPQTGSRRSRGGRKSRVSRFTNVDTKAVIDKLGTLIEVSKNQETRFQPEVPDVPRMRFNRKQIYNVELSYLGTVVSLNTSSASYGALTFALSQFADYTPYTTVFDLFRILQVNVKFVPTSPSPYNYPIYTAFDYDDALAPTSIASLLAYSTVMIASTSTIFERTLTPRLQNAALVAGSATGLSSAPPTTWVSTETAGVTYFGLKYAAGFASTGALTSVTPIVTAMIQFKSQRTS